MRTLVSGILILTELSKAMAPCAIKNFMGGGRGGGCVCVWGGGEGKSERCLKWGVGGSIRNLS